jgi:hypothetical protein
MDTPIPGQGDDQMATGATPGLATPSPTDDNVGGMTPPPPMDAPQDAPPAAPPMAEPVDAPVAPPHRPFLIWQMPQQKHQRCQQSQQLAARQLMSARTQ